MDLRQIFDFGGRRDISDFYAAAGSFGIHDVIGSVTKPTDDGFIAEWGDHTVRTAITEDGGVFLRQDSIENTGSAPLTLTHYRARFTLTGDAYDVYTQQSFWQNESRGAWQPLVTAVSVTSGGMYTSREGAPMLAVYNRQSRRGIVFHLLPRTAYRLTARKATVSNTVYTVIEAEIYDPALSLTLAPGEVIEPSPILYYEFSDRLSLDAHILHAYLNRHYPRRRVASHYNTWLAHFAKVSYEAVMAEIDEATAIGCEYFTLDAGWFGEGGHNMWHMIGDWRENTTGGYEGKMAEIAARVRERGMRFGLWFEPERAVGHAPIITEHPEYFVKGADSGSEHFLDFANPEARRYITDTLNALIDRYGIKLIKLDFNSSFPYDPGHGAFYHYHRGQKEFLAALRAHTPDLYIECCAGGGYRMEIENLIHYDGFWFSDNQSPYAGLDIIKGTLLRLPPAAIEHWAVFTEAEGFRNIATGEDETRLVATDDAKWENVVGAPLPYMLGFLTGGMPAFSCRLTRLSAATKESLRAHLAAFRENRDFYAGATCRILADGDGVLCLHLENADRHLLIFYADNPKHPSVTVYPTLSGRDYTVNGEERSHDVLLRDGITVTLDARDARCVWIE